jgi:ketosteroid isomerase-like protein
MKRRIAPGVIALLLAAAGHATDATDGLRESAKRIFEKIEKDWANALVNADKAGLDYYEAPQYSLVTATGVTLTKAQSDGELLNGNQHFDALEISGIEVYRSGNLAVVTGHAKSKEQYRGQDNSGDYEFVDVFTRRHGRWLAVRAQLTRIASTDR